MKRWKNLLLAGACAGSLASCDNSHTQVKVHHSKSNVIEVLTLPFSKKYLEENNILSQVQITTYVDRNNNGRYDENNPCDNEPGDKILATRTQPAIEQGDRSNHSDHLLRGNVRQKREPIDDKIIIDQILE